MTFLMLLLVLALGLALAFEFVNGFHDSANAVATVIYTNTLEPRVAVVWSGIWNFLGAIASSGAVAYSIVHLVPLAASIPLSFCMIFAILLAAIIWNLGTWYFGIPASSSHTLIGSILGVGMANAMLQGGTLLAGLNVAKAASIGYALLFSPLIGFFGAIILFVLLKLFVKNEKLYKEPKKKKAPPFWIRLLLLATCSGVSFAHGSNDGQKGMGIIMLILLAAFPVFFAGHVAALTIPFWVKLVVALALGLGTMIGYKRIVITVGEKIGKSHHLTYGQGAVAEAMTALTIGAADLYGMPVSTTHILNSSVGGTMAANGSGLQWGTVRNILLAWVMTLPVTMVLSGTLFTLFVLVFI